MGQTVMLHGLMVLDKYYLILKSLVYSHVY